MPPGGIGHTFTMLRHLLLNFAAITPELAGGVATVCQAMAHQIPARLPGARTTFILGKTEWGPRYPLPEDSSLFSLGGLSSRRSGAAVEAHLDPRGLDSPVRWARSIRQVFGAQPSFRTQATEGTLVHCPYQVTHPLPPKTWHLPYVINLHDIQHEHFPEFFSDQELAWRRRFYLASAQRAQAVCVVDEWTRRDVLAHLPIPEAKVVVAPFGPTWRVPMVPSESLRSELKATYALPEAFLLYPAQTWPHKNHKRLIEGLALLRKERGLQIPLICTGHLNEHHANLVLQAEALGQSHLIQFLGLIPQDHLQALYRMARAIVIPSLFEGGPGIPVLEAMSLGVPLAASRSCGIPAAVGDAGLLFDPLSVPDLAQAVEALWTREDLRRELAERGPRRMEGWSWDRAGTTYLEIYEEVLAQWSTRSGA